MKTFGILLTALFFLCAGCGIDGQLRDSSSGSNIFISKTIPSSTKIVENITLGVGQSIQLFSLTSTNNKIVNTSVKWSLQGGSGTLLVASEGKNAEFRATKIGSSSVKVEHAGNIKALTITVNSSSPPSVSVTNNAVLTRWAKTLPLEFYLEFSEGIESLEEANISFSGSAQAGTFTVSGSGKSFKVTISTMDTNGFISPNIDLSHEWTGHQLSTSLPDSVYFEPPGICDYMVFDEELSSGLIRGLSFSSHQDNMNSFDELSSYLSSANTAGDTNADTLVAVCLKNTSIVNNDALNSSAIQIPGSNFVLIGDEISTISSSRSTGTEIDRSGIYLNNVQGIKIQDLSISLSNSNSAAIYISGNSRLNQIEKLTLVTSGTNSHGVYIKDTAAIENSNYLQIKRAAGALGQANGILFGGGNNYVLSDKMLKTHICSIDPTKAWTNFISNGNISGPFSPPALHTDDADGTVFNAQTYPLKDYSTYEYLYQENYYENACPPEPDIVISENHTFREFQTVLNELTDGNGDGLKTILLENSVTIYNDNLIAADSLVPQNNTYIYSKFGDLSLFQTSFYAATNPTNSSIFYLDNRVNFHLQNLSFNYYGDNSTGAVIYLTNSSQLEKASQLYFSDAEYDEEHFVYASNSSINKFENFVSEGVGSGLAHGGWDSQINITNGSTVAEMNYLYFEYKKNYGSLGININTGSTVNGIRMLDSRGLAGKEQVAIIIDNATLTSLDNMVDDLGDQADKGITLANNATLTSAKNLTISQGWSSRHAIELSNSLLGTLESFTFTQLSSGTRSPLYLHGASQISDVKNGTITSMSNEYPAIYMQDSAHIEKMTNVTINRSASATTTTVAAIVVGVANTFNTINISGNTICNATGTVGAFNEFLAEGTYNTFTGIGTTPTNSSGSGMVRFPWGDDGVLDGTDESFGGISGAPGQNSAGNALQSFWGGTCL